MTVLNELIKEFENIKNTQCKTLQEVVFFDGILSIIEYQYLNREKEQIINAFLAGKKFIDGLNYAPNASRDIAEEWFKNNFSI